MSLSRLHQVFLRTLDSKTVQHEMEQHLPQPADLELIAFFNSKVLFFRLCVMNKVIVEMLVSNHPRHESSLTLTM